MQENPTAYGFDVLPFTAAAQRVRVGMSSGDLITPARSGWLYLNLNTTVTPAGPNPPVDPAAAQSWVVSLQAPKVAGRFSTANAAVPLDSVSGPHTILPIFPPPPAKPTPGATSTERRTGK
jgi:hypothetical protein